MCFFYSLSKKAMEYRNRAKANEMIKQFFFTSGFDYPLLPIITNKHPEKIELANWGLIPEWSKSKEIRKYTLNAKQETIFEKPSFKNPVRNQRCLILADGFFEWKHLNGKKYPHYITLKDNGIFAFAGIWDEWIDPLNGDKVRTYSMVTTEATGIMADIHNTKKRTPIILNENNEFDWLLRDLPESDIKALLNTNDENLLKAHTIAQKPRNRKESILEVSYPELNQGLLF